MSSMTCDNSSCYGMEKTGSLDCSPGTESVTLGSGTLPLPSEYQPSSSSGSSEPFAPNSRPLPASLSPAAAEQLEIELKSDGKQCVSCSRFMPIEAFSKSTVSGIEYRNPRCNQCRAYRQKHSPKAVLRRQLLAEAKAAPCADCGGHFAPESMDFVCVSGLRQSRMGSSFNWMRMDRLKEALSRHQVVCANCTRIRAAAQQDDRRKALSYLADLPHVVENVDPITHHRKNVA